MTGRGRKRGRPPKTQTNSDRGGGTKKFNYLLLKKPKYLSNNTTAVGSEASRASSPQEGSDNSRNHSRLPASSTRGRGRGRKSLPQPSTSYASRRGRSFESEYHYGSDFGDSDEKEDDLDDDLLIESSEEESHDEVSESDFSLISFVQGSVGRPPRPPSPDPVWLQDREFPPLELPESSHDLLINNAYVMSAVSIYEVLRRFRHLVRLSPFRFEDFCAALICDEQTSLLTEVHITLLKAILREEDIQGTHFGPLDQKDSINISLYLIDAVTWPEVLRSYVESDKSFDRQVYAILCKGEYPHTNLEDRLCVLKFLTDQFITTNSVRDVMLQEGPIHYDDHCRNCHRLGDLLCCETCPATFHLECVEPPLVDVPAEDWQCGLCVAQKVLGVVDCMTPQEKQGVLIRHDFIGLDRHGRKYWFMARRIFVEDRETDKVWYYSTVPKLETLIDCIDKDDLEHALYNKLDELRDDLENQFELTLAITNKVNIKAPTKSYLDLEIDMTTNNFTTTDEAATEKLMLEDKVVPYNKLRQINNTGQYFKLGSEMGCKSFVNHYTTNIMALNKPQRNEERDKRRHLSHKFSLTTASEFKWIGMTIGTAEQAAATLRQTLLNLEQNIAMPFLNPNWATLKRLWNSALAQARRPSDFAILLLLLQASLKNVVFANVWHEHLGHTELKRITAAEREERKKIEKREKREREEEEERYRYCQNYIKYVLGLRHQVFKQKGEEYRTHGQWSWMWLSASRRVCHVAHPQGVVWGQKIVPARVQVHYSNGPQINHVVCIDPRTLRYMQQLEREVANNMNHRNNDNYRQLKILTVPSNEEVEAYLKQEVAHKSGVIDVSLGLNMPGRLLYPKVAARSRLDSLLERRMELMQAEENLSVPLVKDDDNEDSNASSTLTSTTSNGNDYASSAVAVEAAIDGKTSIKKQTFLEKRLLLLVEQNPKFLAQTNNSINIIHDLVNSLAKKIQNVRLQFSVLNRFGKSYRCYTRDCNTNSNSVAQITQSTCYSPLCLQKAKAKKELLLLLRRAHAAGKGSKETVAAILGAVKKPSILEQKLTEGRRSELGNLTYCLNMDDAELARCHEEAPLDLMQDLEHAFLMGDSYDDNLWHACCPLLTKEEEMQMKIKLEKEKTEDAKPKTEDVDDKTSSTATTANNDNNDMLVSGVEDETTFMDTLDVCGTVEIESTDATTTDATTKDATIEDDVTAQLTEANTNGKLTTTNTRNKKRSRTRSISLGRDTSPIGKRSRRSRQGGRKSLASEKKEAAASAAAEAARQKLKQEEEEEEGEEAAAATAQKLPVRENRRFPSKLAQQAAAAEAAEAHIKREDKEYFEREYFDDGRERIYTRKSTRGRLYLYMDAEKWREEALKEFKQRKYITNKDDNKNEAKKKILNKKFTTFVNTKKTYSKFPLISNFLTHKHKKSLFIIPRYKLLKLARMGGKSTVSGFHHVAKNNNSVWPYPCSRPLFKTCWAYRTLNAVSLGAVALQLRIMWSCMRWDDMIAKPPSADGKHQLSSDTEIVTVELLKSRNMGRYGEKTQYLRRKVIIPLQMPKTIREVTSIRSGLRKRKRAESPQPTEPKITEEWVDENKLELWEIKFIGERQERTKLNTTTRAAAMRANAAAADNNNLSLNSSTMSNPCMSSTSNENDSDSYRNGNNQNKSCTDIKEKMEQQLKLQRAVHQQKRLSEANTVGNTTTRIIPALVTKSGAVIGSRRMIVKAPDGTTRIIQQAISSGANKVNNGTNTSNNVATNTHANNINLQNTQYTNYDNSTSTTNSTNANIMLNNNSNNNNTNSNPAPQQHKVQIIRGSDGKVSVRGLNPGQQLIQMPDGKLHVLTASTSTIAAGKVKVPLKTAAGTVIGKSIAVKQISNNNKNGPTAKLLLPVKPTTSSVNNNFAGNSTVSLLDNNNKTTMQQQPQHNLRIGTHGRLEYVQQVNQKPLQNMGGAAAVAVATGSSGDDNNLTTTTTTIPVSGQKVIQQIVNTSNVQQQIVVGGQRIILSPGQTIVTQRSIPQTTQGQQQQQQQVHVLQATSGVGAGGIQQQLRQQQQQQQQQQVVSTTTSTPQTKFIKPIMQQQQPQQQQNINSTTTNNTATAATSNSMPTHHQLIVQNSALAQQLAQGKLQVANINGQQVIIKPLGNNQAQIVAHVKTQNDGNSHIVTSNTLDSSNESQTQNKFITSTPTSSTHIQQQQQPQQQQPQQQQQQQVTSNLYVPQQDAGISTTTLSPQSSAVNNSGLSMEESMRLLQGQPPGTVIKCVTAQVIQTDQGPRIVLQGLVGNDFNPQQLALVQQQVKQQLLKAQESSGKQGVLGPTKIYLAVQPSQIAPILNSQPPPLTPVQQSPQQQNSSLERIIITSSDAKDNINSNKSHTTTTINGAGAGVGNTSLDLIVANDDSVANGDIIREIEELQQRYDQQQLIKKQLQQQQQQQHQHNQKIINQAIHIVGTGGYSAVLGADNNITVVNNLQQLKQQQQQLTKQQNVTKRSLENNQQQQQLQLLQQQQKNGTLTTATTTKRATSNITKRRESVVSYGRGRDKFDLASPLFSPVKSNPKLDQYKDELKKNILRKRAILERNIRMEINDEMYTTKTFNVAGAGAAAATSSTVSSHSNSSISAAGNDDCENTLTANVVSRKKNKLQKMPPTVAQITLPARSAASPYGRRTKSTPSVHLSNNKTQVLLNSNPTYTPRKPRSYGRGGSYSVGQMTTTLQPRNPQGRPRKIPLQRKEKLYCICNTPYDDTKFYVGCDVCSNWFHGDCVNISEEASKKLTEFICDDCKLARNTQQLYCLCRQPYDESQFYICCDKCQDWFHGRCVGIVQTEADFIDEYVCPDCQQNNTTNRANMKNLTAREIEDLKKLLKVIKAHKSAWPFKEAVDPKEAPDYYNIIKEPMDLQMIENKLCEYFYPKLSDFIGDMTKMFDNCRYYNDKDSTFFKCAEALESFFVQKIKDFRRSVLTNA